MSRMTDDWWSDSAHTHTYTQRLDLSLMTTRHGSVEFVFGKVWQVSSFQEEIYPANTMGSRKAEFLGVLCTCCARSGLFFFLCISGKSWKSWQAEKFAKRPGVHKLLEISRDFSAVVSDQFSISVHCKTLQAGKVVSEVEGWMKRELQ